MTDAGLGQLHGKGACHLDDGSFGSGVAESLRQAHEAQSGAYVDNSAVTRADHVFAYRPAAVEYAGNIDLLNQVPVLIGYFSDGRANINAGVVDQDIDFAKFFDGPRDKGLDGASVCYVQYAANRSCAGCL
jgi:hypothetical protein